MVNSLTVEMRFTVCWMIVIIEIFLISIYFFTDILDFLDKGLLTLLIFVLLDWFLLGGIT